MEMPILPPIYANAIPLTNDYFPGWNIKNKTISDSHLADFLVQFLAGFF
jgi:hypothetical protein